MFAMRLVVVAAAALVFLGVADAFVSPSAFVRATVSISSSSTRVGAATATARAAGAMRCRPAMNVIDVRGREESLCVACVCLVWLRSV